jgi:hypothetical protein
MGEHELALQNIIYVPDLKLNILSTKRLKRDNYVRYSNWILYHLFDRATRRTIVEANGSSRLPVILVSPEGEKSDLLRELLTLGELNHFKALDLYYTDTANQQISLDLAYQRLGHISKRLVKKLVKGMSTGINLKGMDAYEVRDTNERYDECVISQIKAKPFPLRQPTNQKGLRLFKMIHMDLLTRPESALDGHYKYLLVIVNNYTWYSWVYRLRSKDIKAT